MSQSLKELSPLSVDAVVLGRIMRVTKVKEFIDGKGNLKKVQNLLLRDEKVIFTLYELIVR